MKSIRKTYNDGYLQFGQTETGRSETGKRIGNVFVEEGRLAYSEQSCREQDYQMADILSRSLDVKVKTPLPPDYRLFSRKRVKVSGVTFDVIKVDADRANDELYLYLQEVGS